MTRRVAAVFAHPDDDTYSIAGSCMLIFTGPIRRIASRRVTMAMSTTSHDVITAPRSGNIAM